MRHKYSIFVLSTIIWTNTTYATEADAKHTFLALCDVWRIATQGQLPPFSVPQENENYKQILYYNISVADKAWHALLDTASPAGDWDAMSKTLKAADNKLNWADKWPKWRQQRQHTKPNSEPSSWAAKNKGALDEYSKARNRHSLRAIAERAEALQSQLMSEPADEKGKLADQINSALQKAMCGSEPTYAYDPATKKCKDSTAALTKHTTCGKTLNGKTIGMDIVCMCCDDTDAACGPTNSHTHACGDSANAKIEKTTSNCPEKGPVTDLTSELNVALSRVAALMSANVKKAGQTILGVSTTTTCTASDNDNCVDYHNYYSGTGHGLTSVPWVAQLLAAKAAYQKYNHELDRRAAIGQQLEALAAEANREYTRVHTAPSAAPQIDRDKNNALQAKEKESECTAIKQAENCIKNGNCKWESGEASEGNYCKLNTTAVQQQATQTGSGTGAASGGAGASAGCAKHGSNEEACLAEKKDDKPVCAFRTGKDNEPEKEKKMPKW
uniref:Variant surface glycoprotein n=1 Tax=Trypanosoma brucei TaxID=5691 RepID=A0A1V0FXV3_9TRYP|nr:variant surface glycoprotein [Trypanosoma brucei]